MFDYETYKFLWWLLIGVLVIGFAIMDGHDMGVGSLLPFIGKNDDERRVVIDTVEAHWEGNQVWFIFGGGAIFAAWPLVYGTSFSGFYGAMLAVLWAMFFRPVGFSYRSKISNPAWRNSWDWALFIGSAVPPLIFGVAFGNLLQGVPFHFDHDLRAYYTGNFWQLLNPFGLLAGVVSVAMIITQGATYLMVRTEGDIYRRSRTAAIVSGLLTLVSFAVAGVWVVQAIAGYVIISGNLPGAQPNPLDKTVVMQAGAWLNNYRIYPLTLIIPGLAFIGGILAVTFACRGKSVLAFIGSSLSILGIIATAGVSMFPFIMPSSSDPASSLTVWDSASSYWTLALMFWSTMIFLPIIGFYTSWAYKVMAGKISVAHIKGQDTSAY